MKTLRDPVHGDIGFTSEELRIVDTPEFQRLRGIRQLGTSYLVFPGAQHTRFEHSLGTTWMAKRMVQTMNDKARLAGVHASVDADEARVLAMAALIHDITHIPFGHTFEDERRILPAHDKSESRLNFFLHSPGLGTVLKHLGVRERLKALFSQKQPRLMHELVAGPICADLLDYLARDAYFCGLKLGYDDRILRYLNVESGGLCFDLYDDGGFRHDAWSELINLLRIRHHLTERVYYHHTKVITGAMLSRILEAALQRKRISVRELYTLKDEGLLLKLENAVRDLKGERRLLEDFLSRRLYKRVYMVARDPFARQQLSEAAMERFQKAFHFNQDQARTEMERRLAKRLGVPVSAVILYAPDTRMQLKEAWIKVRVDSGPLLTLADLQHPELDALKIGHHALWRFFLFMDGRYEDKFRRAIGFMESELGLPNQLESHNQGQMTLRF